MQTLSVRSSVAVSAAAAEPVDVEVAPVEEPESNGKEAVATLRHVRGAPNKVRRVLDTIRGRSYEEALMILEYMPYKACEPILKTLVSV
jgi:ribosomal protein L22